MPAHPQNPCRFRGRSLAPGFTLLEVTIAAAVLAVAVVALTQAVVAGQMQSYAAMRQSRAVTLAEGMMEEVLARGYSEKESPGPESGETRATYSIDDYDGFTMPAESITTVGGEDYPAVFQDFSCSVKVSYEDVGVTGLEGKRRGATVTVTVDDPRGPGVTLTRFVPAPADAEAL